MTTRMTADADLILVTDDEVRRHVPFAVIMAAIERAFVALETGKSEVFEVVRGKGGGAGHFFAIKSGRDSSIPAIGLKVGSYVPGNLERGLPSHSSLTVLVDDGTGRAYAVVQANYLNGLRTAAADALAVRELARPDTQTLGIIGIGDEAICEAVAVAHVRPIERLLATGSSPARRALFAQAMQERLGLDPEFVDAETAARSADVLITATPARSPVIEADWIRPGTHVSAMGADDVGKQELPVELVRRADLWVDHVQQAMRIGETQHAAAAGVVTESDLREKTLGRLLGTGFRYRRDPAAITVFDSSGLAVQDLAAAQAAVDSVLEARRKQRG